MRTRLLSVGLAAALLLGFASQADAAAAPLEADAAVLAVPDPITCAGYPEPRIPIEVQSWWAEPNQSDPAHLHAMTCFPVARNMSGTSVFDVRIMLHNNPGTLFAISFDFYSGHTNYNNITDVNCGLGNDCTYWYSITVNWNNVPAGWRELRLKPRVSFPPCGPSPCDEDAGATQFTSTGWPVQVRGGTSGTRSECANPANVCRMDFRGWYEHAGYANVSPTKARNFMNGIPVWSGASHAEPIRFYNNLGSGEDRQLTGASCRVNPNFHDPAYVDNPFYTSTFAAGTKVKNVTINVPLTGLAPGVIHRLVCVTSSDLPNAPIVPGDLGGVMSLPFMVSG